MDNYFVACGMCSAGVMGAPGMGRLTAELVTEGSCSWDTTAIDIKRLTKEQNNKLFLRDRVRGVLGQQYKIAYPDAQISDARPLKASPLYDILTMNGADWGEIGGWERARWFNKYSTGKPLVEFSRMIFLHRYDLALRTQFLYYLLRDDMLVNGCG